MSEPSGSIYKVVRSEGTRQQLREWAERAKVLGLAKEYGQALREIEAFLSTDPINWGDPIHRSKHLGLLICRGIYWDIMVRYGIHEPTKTVFILSYTLVLNNPLRQETDGDSNGKS